MEEMDFIVDTAKESMDQALAHLEKEMLNLRAGKANPIMLSSVKLDYYGTMTAISQVANINTPDARTITVQPWEKGMLQEIEKAILIANLGFNPPPLTEERRRDLAKIAKSETENAKIGIRAARKEANDDIKKSEASDDIQKNYEIDIQELTDSYNAKADEIFRIKEKEILTV